MVFINYDLENGKKVKVHYLALFEQEFQINIHITKLLVDNGIENIRLMPKIHEKDKVNRERYFGKHLNSPKQAPMPSLMAYRQNISQSSLEEY